MHTIRFIVLPPASLDAASPPLGWTPDLSRFAGPLYQRIADAIVEAVANGALPAGQRLPTHRDLAARLGVSLRTITRAYSETAQRGITTGTAGRGTFAARRNAAPATLPRDTPDPAGAIDLALNALPIGARANLFRRGLARVAVSVDIEELLTYMPPEGAWRHREAGAAWAALRGMGASAAGVTLCCGTQHALLVSLLHLTQPGNTVLTEALNYPGIARMAATLRLKLHGVVCDVRGMRPDALDALCCERRPDAVILTPSGHNPTTITMPAERRAAVAEILARHHVPVIENDVCGHVLEAAPHPLSRHVPDLAYYICGTSKCLAPGLRVGYLLGPLGTARALASIVHATTWSVSGFAAELASQWIRTGTAQRLILWHRKESARRAALVSAVLPGLTLQSASGLYHTWLDLPAPWRGIDFASQLASAGVHVSPAEVFTVDANPAPQAIRISLGGALTDSRLNRAMRIIRGLLERRPADVFSDPLV
jgi:DNA-binding transcriptional MocR family regulator